MLQQLYCNFTTCVVTLVSGSDNYSTLKIPTNEKFEHRSVLCNEWERGPLHTLLVAMRCYANYMMRAVSLSVMPCE